MDWKTIGAVAGTVTLPFLAVLVAMVIMFNQVNARIDTLQLETHRRFDNMQAEMNRRFDLMQAENQREHEAIRTENRREHDAMQSENRHEHNTMQTENQRQHDEIKEVLRVFEGRITRLEEKAGISPENPD